jgi:molybdopterin converting factor small subunit
VNGRHVSHLPEGLETELADGDEVSVFPVVAGG